MRLLECRCGAAAPHGDAGLSIGLIRDAESTYGGEARGERRRWTHREHEFEVNGIYFRDGDAYGRIET